jgi:hypothetical protein
MKQLKFMNIIIFLVDYMPIVEYIICVSERCFETGDYSRIFNDIRQITFKTDKTKGEIIDLLWFRLGGRKYENLIIIGRLNVSWFIYDDIIDIVECKKYGKCGLFKIKGNFIDYRIEDNDFALVNYCMRFDNAVVFMLRNL